MASGIFGGGNGTINNPYLIQDVDDFLAIGNFTNHEGILAFKQMVDIDLKDINDFQHFELSLVDLIYDANGFEVKNLTYINSPSSIFYVVSSINLSNVIFRNIKLQGSWDAGIVGYINDTTTKNHSFNQISVYDSSFISDGQSTGLLVGTLSSFAPTGDITFNECTVDNCVFKGNYVTAIAYNISSHKITSNKCRVLNSIFGAGSNGYTYASFFIYGSSGDGVNDVNVVYSNCYAKGNSVDMSTITYDLYLAGFMNYFRNGMWSVAKTEILIKECYLDNDFNIQHSNISGNGIYFGGFIGDNVFGNKGGLTILNSFLLGGADIYTTEQIGYGRVGEVMPEKPTSDFYLNIINTKKSESFTLPKNQDYNSELDNQLSNTITIEQSKQRTTYVDGTSWDFNTIWKITEGVSTPFFRLAKAIKLCKTKKLGSLVRRK